MAETGPWTISIRHATHYTPQTTLYVDCTEGHKLTPVPVLESVMSTSGWMNVLKKRKFIFCDGDSKQNKTKTMVWYIAQFTSVTLTLHIYCMYRKKNNPGKTQWNKLKT